jgi:hypothetical protein
MARTKDWNDSLKLEVAARGLTGSVVAAYDGMIDALHGAGVTAASIADAIAESEAGQ